MTMSIESLKLQPVWLAWRYEIKNGKKTKVPYQLSGAKASTTDPKTWCKFEKAVTISPKDGIGIVFEPSQNIVGIDFDHCLTETATPPWLEDFLTKANSYIEFSPSKTGCHVLFSLSSPVKLESNKHSFDSNSSVEVYSSGRYFTFTQDEMPQSQPLRCISPDEFVNLLKSLGYPWKAKVKPILSTVFATNDDDDNVLQKMFSSKNGEKIRLLFSGDASPYNNDLSSADFALCVHLAYWTKNNADQISRLWLSSPLASRDKTQKREDYRARTIKNAMEATHSSSPSQKSSSVSAIKEEIVYDFLLSCGKNPVPLLAFPNILRVLRKNPFFHEKFRKNDFSHLVESLSISNEWITLNDDTISKAREFISENFSPFHKVSKDMVTDAIMRVAGDHSVNPPRDYFSALVWDQIPRLNSWLHRVFGVPDDELHQAIGSNWLKGLVKRVMRPGCQFDEVLALESPQGWLKSSSIRILGQPWHVETTHSIDNKDFYLILAQNVIVEFSEGEIFDRASVNKLKAEVTKTEDQVRPPYERGIVKFKRSCVFAVTTNKLELKDDTGNRRWLPVTLEKPADVEWLKENRDQLFAEAFHRVIVLRESTHVYPTELLEDVQKSRGEWSDYDEKVLFWFASLFPTHQEKEGIALHDACAAAFGGEIRIGKLEELQVASILRRTLYLESKNKKINGAVLKRWFPTEKTRKILQKMNEAKLSF